LQSPPYRILPRGVKCFSPSPDPLLESLLFFVGEISLFLGVGLMRELPSLGNSANCPLFLLLGMGRRVLSQRKLASSEVIAIFSLF